MKPHHKLLTLILLTTMYSSMIFFSELNRTFYCNAATAKTVSITKLSTAKQSVINEFKKLSTTSKNFKSSKSIIVRFKTKNKNEIKKFENNFKLLHGSQLDDELNLYSYDLKNNLTLDDLIKLNQSSLVEYVEADYAVSI